MQGALAADDLFSRPGQDKFKEKVLAFGGEPGVIYLIHPTVDPYEVGLTCVIGIPAQMPCRKALRQLFFGVGS